MEAQAHLCLETSKEKLCSNSLTAREVPACRIYSLPWQDVLQKPLCELHTSRPRQGAITSLNLSTREPSWKMPDEKPPRGRGNQAYCAEAGGLGRFDLLPHLHPQPHTTLGPTHRSWLKAIIAFGFSNLKPPNHLPFRTAGHSAWTSAQGKQLKFSCTADGFTHSLTDPHVMQRDLHAEQLPAPLLPAHCEAPSLRRPGTS